ncbi:MAG: Nif3-like dinuclear metal center hexameric protein [Sphingobacteriales bacterium]|nr:Nif3-like dinuclear metal center hexameric protein [Sphingobacteriales bacterium]
MKIASIVACLESWAPLPLQESYDNAGLITGDTGWECTGIICSLDATEAVVKEAITRGCNLVVSHHPIIFGGLKKINGKNYVERAIITAIKNDIALYAIHTNLDNILSGVNGRIADQLGLQNRSILSARENTLRKLFTFVPADHAEAVRNALFDAGAGQIGLYSECSFNSEGTGTFKAGENANPYVGEKNRRHHEKEIKLELVFPTGLQPALLRALKAAHPYEEVAYDVVELANPHPETGSGLLGDLPQALEEQPFLQLVKTVFGTPLIRHTAFPGRPVKKVAVCGGAGSFLISKALAAGADAYITADMKYHEFFDANSQLLIADPGHFETEQFTIPLLQEVLAKKFPTFAVLKTEVETNPVRYFA